MAMNKDVKRIFKDLERQGFTIRPTSAGHYQIRNPQRQIIAICSGTPSDRRAFQNFLADLRRAGYRP